MVLFRTGLRRSDAIRLQFKHVDFKAQQIRLTAQKSGKNVRIPILPDLLSALEMDKWPLQHFIDSGAAEDYANSPNEDYAAILELGEARAAGRAAPAGTFD